MEVVNDNKPREQHRGGGNTVAGVVLILLGVFFFLEKVLEIDIQLRKYWPILLIIAGIYILLKDRR